MKIKENKLFDYSKELRLNMTKEEKKIWYDYLSKSPIRFRRQYIIGNYIADFYSHILKLVIEIDGKQHYEEEQGNHDIERTQYMNDLGIKVIRIDNKEINSNFRSVCHMLDEYILKQVEELGGNPKDFR